ncbi:MAG: hypothetical protein ABSA45_09670 [Verrucomicrobiota bacterium]
MAIPKTTSAEAFERYVGGKCLVACRGKAWRDIKARIIAPVWFGACTFEQSRNWWSNTTGDSRAHLKYIRSNI